MMPGMSTTTPHSNIFVFYFRQSNSLSHRLPPQTQAGDILAPPKKRNRKSFEKIPLDGADTTPGPLYVVDAAHPDSFQVIQVKLSRDELHGRPAWWAPLIGYCEIIHFRAWQRSEGVLALYPSAPMTTQAIYLATWCTKIRDKTVCQDAHSKWGCTLYTHALLSQIALRAYKNWRSQPSPIPSPEIYLLDRMRELLIGTWDQTPWSLNETNHFTQLWGALANIYLPLLSGEMPTTSPFECMPWPRLIEAIKRDAEQGLLETGLLLACEGKSCDEKIRERWMNPPKVEGVKKTAQGVAAGGVKKGVRKEKK